MMVGPEDADSLDPGPCGECPKHDRCGYEKLACEAFAMFAHGHPPERYRLAPRAPSRAKFELLFEAPRVAAAERERRRETLTLSLARGRLRTLV
jgi:hypothetical protein